MIRLIIIAALVGLAIAAIRSLSTRNRSRCSTCIHRRKIFEDGTLCGFGDKETFKTIVHVTNCRDHARR